MHSAGLLLCRFNRFSVMKKQIAVGGHRSFHITSKVSMPGGHTLFPSCLVWMLSRELSGGLDTGHGRSSCPLAMDIGSETLPQVSLLPLDSRACPAGSCLPVTPTRLFSVPLRLGVSTWINVGGMTDLNMQVPTSKPALAGRAVV